MTPEQTHLTEDERHAFADGSLPPEQRSVVESHVNVCEPCAADVARITNFMTRIQDAPRPDAPLDELWPSIRGRIEQSKVVPLPRPADAAIPQTSRGRLAWIGIAGGIAAAALIAVVALRGPRQEDNPVPGVGRGDQTSLIAVADSARAYEEEARLLLDKFELQRALLRPEAAQALDHDLRVVDVAIAELKDAVARDPNNPALRQLLATSYRQKVDLLKRIGNAS